MKKSGVNLMRANHEWSTRPSDERFETIDALEESVLARRKASREWTAPVYDISATSVSDGQGSTELALVSESRGPLVPTHWAFGQFCRELSAPSTYLRRLPGEVAAKCLNFDLDRRFSHDAKAGEENDEKWLAVDRPDGVGLSMRAVTKPTYGRIYDATVVEKVKKVLASTGGVFFNPKDWSGRPSGLYASDRDVFMFFVDGGSMVDGGGERDQLQRGFFAWNSEVGKSTFGVSTFRFRVVCGNHIIWDVDDLATVRIRHTSRAPERFEETAVPALLEFSRSSVAKDEAVIRAAKRLELPAKREEVDDWLDRFRLANFTKGEVSAAITTALREEGRCGSLWDLVNGFTASARDMAWIDARIDLETRAGKLLQVAAEKAA